MKHFLKETDFTLQEAAEVLSQAQGFKKSRGHHLSSPLEGNSWGMVFSKSSTRTRVSFEVGIHELGGKAIFLNQNDIQLGRGESIGDTAKVLSRYLHGLIVRTYDHEDLVKLSEDGSIPIVNALTDFLHPCQLYTDVFTLAERWATDDDLIGSLKGKKVAFFGDCASNVSNSWILGANLFGMKIALAGPEEFAPGPEIVQLLEKEGYGSNFEFTTDPEEAAKDADVLYTDVWVSMGKEEEAAGRIEKMMPYSVTDDLLSLAKPDAYFMHCLPAYPGKEVSQEVLDNPRSIIFDQAENRLHAQKGILAVLSPVG